MPKSENQRRENDSQLKGRLFSREGLFARVQPEFTKPVPELPDRQKALTVAKAALETHATRYGKKLEEHLRTLLESEQSAQQALIHSQIFLIENHQLPQEVKITVNDEYTGKLRRFFSVLKHNNWKFGKTLREIEVANADTKKRVLTTFEENKKKLRNINEEIKSAVSVASDLDEEPLNLLKLIGSAEDFAFNSRNYAKNFEDFLTEVMETLALLKDSPELDELLENQIYWVFYKLREVDLAGDPEIQDNYEEEDLDFTTPEISINFEWPYAAEEKRAKSFSGSPYQVKQCVQELVDELTESRNIAT